MIKLLVLFLSVYGTLAYPHASHVECDDHLGYSSSLPGTEEPKVESVETYRKIGIPCLLGRRNNLPVGKNLTDRFRVPQQLPGTGNLAEKRIPNDVLMKLAQSPN